MVQGPFMGEVKTRVCGLASRANGEALAIKKRASSYPARSLTPRATHRRLAVA